MKSAIRAIRCSMRRCDDRPSFLFLFSRLKLRRQGGYVIGSRWDRDDCRTLNSEGPSRAGRKEKAWAGCTHRIYVSWPMFLSTAWLYVGLARRWLRERREMDVATWWVTRELFDRKRPSRGGQTSSVVLLSHATLCIDRLVQLLVFRIRGLV